MSDKLEGILEIDDSDEVAGHAHTRPAEKPAEAGSNSFRRIRAAVVTDDEDEDVEGHSHIRHRRR